MSGLRLVEGDLSDARVVHCAVHLDVDQLTGSSPTHETPADQLTCVKLRGPAKEAIVNKSFAVAAAVAAALGFSESAGAQARSSVSYAKDVAPLLHRSCASCHRPSMFAPMSLLTYEETRPWARAIKQRVVRREMPPWSADAPHGMFRNDPRLSQADIDTIVAWVDAGAPRGDGEMPTPPTFTGGWTIGTPDAIFTMTEDFAVPAEGTIPYQYSRVPTNLKEDKWIQAMEIRPGNREVVHHVIANAQPVGGAAADERTPGRVGLGGITPNMPGVVYPPGVARLLPANSEIILQMHYTTTGTAATDRTSIAVIYAKEPPGKMIGGGMVMNAQFTIPPGADNHEVRASQTLQRDTVLTGMMPHMHVRGKDMTYTAYYPDGRTETLLSVPKYAFDWQISYELVEPKLLPKGTRIEVVAHFDNSSKNIYNPDPTQTVRWGDQTWEEMMIGFITTLVERPAMQPNTTSGQP
jgi:mono/diheme cytochrome c family protein